ncbi:hypothetical protein D3C71_1476630 [compost metagenome]
MTNIASSATVRVAAMFSNAVQRNSATLAIPASSATSKARDSGSNMLAAAMLNSSDIEMPALAPGSAWLSRVAATMSSITLQNTMACSQRSLRPHSSSAAERNR